MLAEAVGNFLRPHLASNDELPEVRPGGLYRHSDTGNVVETAQVIDVGPDTMGIPHVRYKVLVERSREKHTHFEAIRTQNLRTFASHFSEAVEA